MGKIIKDAGALLAITLVAGFLLGLVYDVTLEPIQVQEELAKKRSMSGKYSQMPLISGKAMRIWMRSLPVTSKTAGINRRLMKSWRRLMRAVKSSDMSSQ